MDWLSILGAVLVCVSYSLAAGVLLWRGRPSWPNRIFVIALSTTSAWAAAVVVQQTTFSSGIVPDLFAAGRDGAWIALLVAFLRQDSQKAALWQRFAYCAIAGTAADFAFVATGGVFDTGLGVRLTAPFFTSAISVLGLVLIENLLRNLPRARLWSLKLLAIALAALFSYNLLVIFPEILAGLVPQGLIAGLPFLYILLLPLFVVTAIRNETLRLQIHSSRTVAFHSATIVSAGVVLQGVAVAAYYVKRFGGTSSTVIAIVVGFAALIGFVVAVSSQSLRSRLKMFINENFYSYKYDYRLEWTKFIQTLSYDQDSTAPERVLKTLTNLLDSPGGILWVRRESWHQFLPLAHWSLPERFGPIDAADPLITSLQADTEFLEINENVLHAEWKSRFPLAWLIIPIRFQERLIALALLQRPRAPRKLDWEDRNLFRIVVLELGAHLVHEHMAQTLTESQQLVEFNKRLTFALHDLKNAGGQLKLLAGNVEKFGHNPEFRTDMLATIRHVGDKLERLIDKLKAGEPEPEITAGATSVNILDMVTKVSLKPSKRAVRVTSSDSKAVFAVINDPAGLESALEHIIANAAEASPEGSSIEVRIKQLDGTARVEVVDHGPGMTEDFIANSLFKPFHSTKPAGLGVGAYQARSLMRKVGGDLQIQSIVGVGTTATLVIPLSAQHS